MLLLDRLHVNRDVGLWTKTLPDPLLNGCGSVMGHREWCIAVHTDVGLDGKAVTDAPCPQVVGLAYVGERADDLLDFLLDIT